MRPHRHNGSPLAAQAATRSLTVTLDPVHLGWHRGGSHRVVDGLLALIDSGGLQPEQPLPPERELAQRFEVGRRHVRAAMAALIDGGIVEIGSDGDPVVAPTATDPSLAALVRTRRLVSA